MIEKLQLLALVATLAVVASMPKGDNEVPAGGPGGFHLGNTTTSTNRSRLGFPEDNLGLRQFQIGNTTTNTNKTSRSAKYYYMNCPLTYDYYNYNSYYGYGLTWTSPNFPQNYDNDYFCTLYGSGMEYAEITFDAMDLQNKVNGECVDFVSFSLPYGVEKKWCGSKKRKFRLPLYYLEAKFVTDSDVTRSGFQMNIQFLDSPCHEYIYVSPGTSYEFETPNYPQLDTVKNRACALYVYTSWYWYNYYDTYRVRAEFLDFNLNAPCKKNNVILNLNGDWSFPKSSSVRFCGKTLPPTYTSTYTEMLLQYQTNKRSKGFKVRFSSDIFGTTTSSPSVTTGYYGGW